uniref:F-box domain-containing protein n=1 Tax=Strongyloides papillosus TaxID=174720 RepID=A0A0N5BQD9_STREA
MDFELLPDDYKIQIFKKLDWNSVMNTRLVCKSFYFAIGKNITSFDRPKIHTLGVCYDTLNDNKLMIKVNFAKYSSVNNYRNSTWTTIFFDNMVEYEYFLYTFDFSRLLSLEFRNKGKSEFERSINGSYLGRQYVECVYTVYERETEINSSFDKFIQFFSGTTKEVASISYEVKHADDPINFEFLKKKSLTAFDAFNEANSRAIIKKAVNNIITNNPSLHYIHLSTNGDGNLYKEVTKYVYDHEALNYLNRCTNRKFTLFFTGVVSFTSVDVDFYKKLFSKIMVGNNTEIENGDEDYVFETALECPQCKIKHSNSVLFSQFMKLIVVSLK